MAVAILNVKRLNDKHAGVGLNSNFCRCSLFQSN